MQQTFSLCSLFKVLKIPLDLCVPNTKGVMIELCWIPGNAGISANETADIEAKEQLLLQEHGMMEIIPRVSLLEMSSVL